MKSAAIRNNTYAIDAICFPASDGGIGADASQLPACLSEDRANHHLPPSRGAPERPA